MFHLLWRFQITKMSSVFPFVLPWVLKETHWGFMSIKASACLVLLSPMSGFHSGWKHFSKDKQLSKHYFPNNDTLKKISETLQENLCDGCQRDGEDEEAKQFCLMCKEKLCNMCAKFHRRNLLTKDHEVLSFEKLQKSPIATAIKKSCRAHAGKSIKYYCKDHSVPCCTACVCTAHRKCDNIETASETAERLQRWNTISCPWLWQI